MFHESVAVHAAGDQEPYVLKFDLDRILVMGILRPQGQDHFTLEDLSGNRVSLADFKGKVVLIEFFALN